MNIGELAKFRGGIATDTISEVTSASGVTIDGTLIKDGGVSASGTMSANTISEYTSGSGVSIDTLLLKDGATYPTGAVTGYSALSDGDTTLSVTSNQLGYLDSPSASRSVTLPTTGVKAGWKYRLEVQNATPANSVLLKASNGSEVDRIEGSGFIEIFALQDTPTTPSHWRICDVLESTNNVTLTATGQNTNNVTAIFKRDKRRCTAILTQTEASAGGGTGITISNWPSRFAINNGTGSIICCIRNNGSSAVGQVRGTTFSLVGGGALSGGCGILTDGAGSYVTISYSL